MDARKASRGRSAPSQWWASSAGPLGGLESARPGSSERTTAKRSWSARRSAGNRTVSTTSPSSACRKRRVPVSGSACRTPAATAVRSGSRDLRLGMPRDRGDQLLADGAAGHGHDAEEPLRRVRQARRSGRRGSRPTSAATAGSPRAARPTRAPRRRTGCRRSGHGCARPARRRPVRRGAGRPGGPPPTARTGRGPGGSSWCRAQGRRATSPPDGRARDRRCGRSGPGAAAHGPGCGRGTSRGRASSGRPSGGPRRSGRAGRPRQGRRAARAAVRTAAPGQGRCGCRANPRRGVSGMAAFTEPRAAVWPIPGKSLPISSRAGPRISATRSGGSWRR